MMIDMTLDINTLKRLLHQPCTIAVVGLSAETQRPSYRVASYLQTNGFKIVPVNPRYAASGQTVLGETCYAQLSDIPFAVHIVDVFRRTEDVLPIAQQAIQIGARCLWQQIGVENQQAAQLAQAAGLVSVMNRCLKIDHAQAFQLATPYYLIDETRLQKNLLLMQQIREQSGAKLVLALKCFSGWCVFDLMRPYMDGTTSSSLYEARLGHEKFGKEVHAYSVAYSREEVLAVRQFASKVIFNSVSQLQAHYSLVSHLKLGLRVNPGISYSHFDLADPARRFSRLGVSNTDELRGVAHLLSGVMFHFNCENDDVNNLTAALQHISTRYADVLDQLEWVSLGGGISFSKEGYALAQLCSVLKQFSEIHQVQVYLEPGEAAISQCAELVTTVLDVVHNETAIAIVDASVEAHLLDHLIYHTSPPIAYPVAGSHATTIAGRSCLAGDVFGSYSLAEPLQVGDQVHISDTAGYSMVKKNWFNGVAMPSIAVRRLSGQIDLVRSFGYADYVNSLS